MDKEKKEQENTATEENRSMEIPFPLRKPLTVFGQTFDELHFDFDKLTGATMLKIDDEYAETYRTFPVQRMIDDDYLAIVCRKACRESIMTDDLGRMDARDYDRCLNMAKVLFVGKGKESVFAYKLTTPFNFKGREIEALDFDFEKLTGNDVKKCVKALKAKGRVVGFKNLDFRFLIQAAILACSDEASEELFETMGAHDFLMIMGRAADFFTPSAR